MKFVGIIPSQGPAQAGLSLSRLFIGISIIAITGSSALSGVAMSPLKQEVTLKPGEQAKLTVTVANNAHGEIHPSELIHLEAQDVQVEENGTLTLKPAGSRKDSASAWVTLDKSDVEIETGKSTPVVFTVTVPQFATPGEYYTAVLVTLNRKGRTEDGVVVEYRIASGIFVTVDGRTLNKQARIARCDLLWPSDVAPATQPAAKASTQPVDPPPPTVAVVLKNTGSARFDATGSLVILDTKLRPAYRSPLSSKRPCIFAGDTRLFEAPITKALAAGNYLVNVEMDYQSSWAKAHWQLPVEITPEQADVMVQNLKRKRDEAPLLEANVEKVSQAVYTGGMRSLAVAISNTIDASLMCKTSIVPADPVTDAWLAQNTVIEPGEFSLGKNARRAVELRISVPAGVRSGIYSASLVVSSSVDGTEPRELIVPMEIEVRSQR